MTASAVRLRKAQRALIDGLESFVGKAYVDSVQELRNKITLREVIEALAAQNIQAAIEALHIEDAAFNTLRRSLEHAFETGGSLAADMMPPLRKKNG